MRCPTLRELPPPPPGKTGWPWTEESPQLPDTMPDGRPWPRISIVTPNYNYGQFLEETIRSVLLQGYPDLEYIIIDGGSTDNSVEIIKKYEPWLAYWVSEPDRGQSDAINKGLQRATGEIAAWLNSDDTYLPGTLAVVANALVSNPQWVMVYGDCEKIDAESRIIGRLDARPFDFLLLIKKDFIKQPAAFWRRYIHDTIGFLDTQLHYAMDYDFWLRIALKYENKVSYLPYTLAQYRFHDMSKTCSQELGFIRDHILLGYNLLRNKGIPRKVRVAVIEGLLANSYSFMGRRWRAVGYLVQAWVISYGNLTIGRRLVKLVLQAILGRFYDDHVAPAIRRFKDLVR